VIDHLKTWALADEKNSVTVEGVLSTTQLSEKQSLITGGENDPDVLRVLSAPIILTSRGPELGTPASRETPQTIEDASRLTKENMGRAGVSAHPHGCWKNATAVLSSSGHEGPLKLGSKCHFQSGPDDDKGDGGAA